MTYFLETFIVTSYYINTTILLHLLLCVHVYINLLSYSVNLDHVQNGIRTCYDVTTRVCAHKSITVAAINTKTNKIDRKQKNTQLLATLYMFGMLCCMLIVRKQHLNTS